MSNHRFTSSRRKMALQTSACLTTAALGGCMVQRPHERERGPETVIVHEEPRPRVVEERVVVIQEPPPQPVVEREVIIERERPSPRHVWIPGYWRHDGTRYVWLAGRWEEPPRGRREWVPARYERRGNGWVFIEGSWR